MARRAWPVSGYLPGMSPFPDGYRAPVKRKPTRKRSRGGTLTLALNVERTTSKPLDPKREIRVETIRNEHGECVGSVLWVPRPRPLREPGRPVTYDHPLALAARAGRKHALWSGPVPAFETDAERRAFEVARARKLAWRKGER